MKQSANPTKFLKAMVIEVNTHEQHKQWRIQTLVSVQKRAQVLDSIWAMQRKRFKGTGEVHKYKT